MAAVNTNNEIWRQSRVLVTGGAGFIGSALVWELNERGCANVAIADFAAHAGRHGNLKGLKFTDYVEPSDLLGELESGVLGKFDFIFHLGACSSTTEMNEDYLRRNNFEYSRDLAARALKSGVRFVYASSAATYGDGRAGMDDQDLNALEKLQPLNPYGRSKQMMDVHAWRHGWLDHVVALKYFNVFGPNEAHKGEMQSVVRKSYAQVKETGVIRLFKSYRPEYGDGEQRRDFLYVKDAVAMTLHLAANRAANGIFNIGSGFASTWNELARCVFAALGEKPRIEYIDMPASIREQYQYFTEANIGKLHDARYRKPITPLVEAVHDYVINYLIPNASLGAADSI
ncbi:MAG: ADP-glyceromanno-heptose 6-epimerase [Candidatus Binatia bacterium]